MEARMTLARRLDELGINELHVEVVPNGEYMAVDHGRYDGPGSPYVAWGQTAIEAVEELIAEVKRTPGHYCDYLGRPCPPYCSSALGGCGADEGDER